MVSHRITIVTFLMGTFAVTSLQGQSTSFGAIAGTSFVIESGSNTVEFDNNGESQTIIIFTNQHFKKLGQGVIGMFFEFQAAKRVNVRTELTYTSVYSKYVFYNKDVTCQTTFCGPVKAKVLGRHIIEFAPLAALQVFKTKKFVVSAFAGVSLHFQILTGHSTVTNPPHWDPGQVDVYNALNDVVKPIVLYLNYGIALSYGRFSLCAKQQENQGTYTDKITIQGKSSPFNECARYTALSLRYSLYSFKKRKKNSSH